MAWLNLAENANLDLGIAETAILFIQILYSNLPTSAGNILNLIN